MLQFHKWVKEEYLSFKQRRRGPRAFAKSTVSPGTRQAPRCKFSGPSPKFLLHSSQFQARRNGFLLLQLSGEVFRSGPRFMCVLIMATNRPVTLVSGIHSVVLFRWMRQFPLEACFKSSFETFTATGTFIPY
ncbi:hypothetical protein RDI58_000009 [Solanum bulbocastanum]|uniref:Uncharacterized protein n=1 Tax=Solanum bulbocastanum TaxID=147425 RepID=A0AAN8T472_SOLBU